MQAYEEQKNRKALSAAIDTLEMLAQRRSSSRLAEQSEKLREKLVQSLFNLVVIGEFKRGKSTLINALLGSAVLPTGAVPLTSVPTVVQSGTRVGVEIFLDSGAKTHCRLNDLGDYVTERGNPNNSRGVILAEVHYECHFLRNGVRIIDTPGTESVYLHNTQTTWQYLPQADAVVMVFVADQPATRSELDLLLSAKKFSAKQFFVLNKVDHLTDEEKEESKKFLEQSLESELGYPCKVFAISAKNGLSYKLKGESDSGFSEFENELVNFSMREKNRTLIDSIRSKIQALVTETRNLLDLEQHGMSMPEAKLEQCLKQFRKAIVTIKRQEDDAEFIVTGEVQKLVKTIEKDLVPVVASNEESLQKEIEHQYELHRSLGNQALIEHLKSELYRRIKEIYDDWKVVEEAKVETSFEAINDRFVEKANQVVANVKQLTNELFEVEVDSHFEVEKLQTKTMHRYSVDDPFTYSLQLLPLLLPEALSKPVIRARFIESAKNELTKNSGRLRADYQERLEASARMFLALFRKRIHEALDEIQSVIERAMLYKASTAERLSSANEELESQKRLLDEIESLL